MSWRSKMRTSLVYLVALVAGFSLAWLIVAFVVKQKYFGGGY